MIKQGIVFLCMADESMGKSIPYGYLTEIKDRFMSGSLRERAYHCNAYELKHDFGPVLMNQMKRYNRGDGEFGNNTKVKHLQKDVDGLKSIMTENIGKLIERGERLDILVDKTEDLSRSSESFARSAKKVKNKMWWQNKKMCLILSCVLFIILAIITIIILYEVGVFEAKSSSSSGNFTPTKHPLTTLTTITTTKPTIPTTVTTTAKTPITSVIPTKSTVPTNTTSLL